MWERWCVPDFAYVVEVVVEDLDPMVTPIGNVHVALVVDGDAVRLVKLTRTPCFPVAYHFHNMPVPVELVDM